MNTAFAPIQKSNLADGLAERIADMIRSGTYVPGERLPAIMEMARSFGVGHPSVREALKQLEAVGIVEIKHGSGVYVRKGKNDVLLVGNPVFGGDPSQKLLIDLIEARIPVETKSAKLAAANASEAHFERMRALLTEAGENVDDAAVLNRANMAFHREIAVASENSVLAQLQEVLTNLFQHEQRTILDIYGSRDKDHDEHESIFEALRSRDAGLAEIRMKDHLNGVRQAIIRWDPVLRPVS